VHVLRRVLGTPSTVLLGLGSIVGTGIFVSVATATRVAGSGVLVAVALAALVATCNGLSSAQLAAAHPVSGGAYEYGYRYLGPWSGRIAGFMFVVAKSASAATAALGCAAYLGVTHWIALAIVAALTVIVGITLVGLATFVIAGVPRVDVTNWAISATPRQIIHATALMFVAYTGYGRIATLGEEVRDPDKTIPRAIIAALIAALLLYLSVTAVALGVGGAAGLSARAPLESLSEGPVRTIVSIAAITAMVGVILNLLLGISRVVLAMARRRDLPTTLAVVKGDSPRHAVIAVGVVVALLAATGRIATTWSLSAFSVLIYYAIANLAALRQPREERRFPRAVPILGLASCAALAAFVTLQ
jgi:APA family basic amino acid/polyamine antiporter